MTYKVVLTVDAEESLDNAIRYLLFVKNSKQAASNLLNDFEETKNVLSRVAGSIKLCENPKLRLFGYRLIHFRRHRYFMLYRIVEDAVIVDGVFHDLQDYENKMQ